MVKATIHFIIYSFKPLSKTADIWDAKDIIQAIFILGGWLGGGGYTMIENHSLAVWVLAGVPALLFLFAGIKLQMRLSAKIKIEFDESKQPFKTTDEAYIHPTDNIERPQKDTFRVGIKLFGNESKKVKLTLVKSDPPLGFTPIDLRPHLFEGGFPPEITVNPTKDVANFFEVASYPHLVKESGKNEIRIHYHTIKNIPNTIIPGKYIFTLEAQAENTQSDTRDFIVDVKDDRLIFYPK